MTREELGDFREAVARLCAERFDRTRVRESGEPEPLNLEAWREIGEIGVLGMLGPPSLAGMDLGLAAAVEVWEELGHGMAPGPLTWSALAAIDVEGVATGDVVCTGCVGGDRAAIVEHPDAAAQLIVLGEEVRVHRAGQFELTPIVSVDPFTPLGALFPSGAGDPLGSPGSARYWRLAGACLSAAYLVGLAQLALELGVTHAQGRMQFGRPIAGFQAVKHLLADAMAGTEVARAAVWSAARAVDGSPDSAEAERAAHAAKVVAVEASRISTRNCIQVHGGMGYTWETDPHLIWKRAMLWEFSFGDGRVHAAALAGALGREVVAA